MTKLDKKSDYAIAFGKHRGKAVAEVIEIDPSYVVWLYENVSYCVEEVREGIGKDRYERCKAKLAPAGKYYTVTEDDGEPYSDWIPEN